MSTVQCQNRTTLAQLAFRIPMNEFDCLDLGPNKAQWDDNFYQGKVWKISILTIIFDRQIQRYFLWLKVFTNQNYLYFLVVALIVTQKDRISNPDQYILVNLMFKIDNCSVKIMEYSLKNYFKNYLIPWPGGIHNCCIPRNRM